MNLLYRKNCALSRKKRKYFLFLQKTADENAKNQIARAKNGSSACTTAEEPEKVQSRIVSSPLSDHVFTSGEVPGLSTET